MIVLARADAARGRLQAARERLEAEVAKAPNGDAALELGFVLRDMGLREDAAKLWQAIVDDRADERTPHSIFREGRALTALDQPRRASAAFQEAASEAQNDPRIPTAWAELFLDKHNAKEAAETFETALQADPRWVPALVGYAAAMADDEPGAARASLDKALAIDPACVAAHLWLAEQALDGRRLADAGEEIAKVLAVNPDQVEALSLQAAIAAIEDRTADAEQLAQRVLTLRPGSGAVHRIIGAQLAGHYRFEEAVAQGRKARGGRSDRSAHAGRDRDAPAADRRRSRRAHGARHRVPPRSVRRRHLQLAVDARHARPLPDDHHRRSDPEDPSRTKWG